MNDSGNPRAWLQFARENLRVAEISLDNGLLNPCVQNAQQAVEKALKAALLTRSGHLKRTHNTRELARDLANARIDVGLSDDECELLDSMYLPSKYPPDSALPDSIPDRSTCTLCIEIARRVIAAVEPVVAAA